MKRSPTKIFTIIGLVFHVLAFLFVVGVFLMIRFADPSEDLRGSGLGLLAVGLLLTWIGNGFFVIDAILSVIRIFRKIDPVFNGILSIAVLCLVVSIFGMCVLEPATLLAAISFLLGTILGFVVLILEIISLERHFKMKNGNKQQPCEEE